MNFLELCNRTKVKCRVQGAPMTALTNQTGDYARIIAFVNEAWMAIQLAREDWNWMRATAQFPTVNAKPLYSIADIESTGSGLADFGNWDKTTFRLWITAVGQASEQFLWPIDYDDWRDRYQFSSFRTTYSQPIDVTVAPDFSIGLGPVPLDGYTILGDYFKEPTELEDPTDVPGLPKRFHMIIVYKAMMLYGATEAASEVYQEGFASYSEFLNRMAINQIQTIEPGPALA